MKVIIMVLRISAVTLLALGLLSIGAILLLFFITGHRISALIFGVLSFLAGLGFATALITRLFRK